MLLLSLSGAVAVGRQIFGENNLGIAFSGVDCLGNEGNLTSCPRSDSTECSTEVNDAGVVCQGMYVRTSSKLVLWWVCKMIALLASVYNISSGHQLHPACMYTHTSVTVLYTFITCAILKYFLVCSQVITRFCSGILLYTVHYVLWFHSSKCDPFT